MSAVDPAYHSQVGDSAKSMKDPSQFDSERARLQQNLDSLDVHINELAKRLELVMQGVSTDTAPEGSPHPVLSPVVETVWSAANRVNSAAARVSDLILRLEI